jgi:hypothetical protein
MTLSLASLVSLSLSAESGLMVLKKFNSVSIL